MVSQKVCQLQRATGFMWLRVSGGCCRRGFSGKATAFKDLRGLVAAVVRAFPKITTILMSIRLLVALPLLCSPGNHHRFHLFLASGGSFQHFPPQRLPPFSRLLNFRWFSCAQTSLIPPPNQGNCLLWWHSAARGRKVELSLRKKMRGTNSPFISPSPDTIFLFTNPNHYVTICYNQV